jgi:hypothetical protein
MDVLEWFSHWYNSQCNGDWEHEYGVSINTVDNPGWSIKIDLTGTDCDGRSLDRTTYNYDHETDWWACWTEDNVFHGAGGPLHLHSLLAMFRKWAMNAH